MGALLTRAGRAQVTYKDFHTFTSCIGMNPCWGWLNPDPYWRAFTTARAKQLSATAQMAVARAQAVADETGVRAVYVPVDWRGMFSRYVRGGGRARDLVEAGDGFHPSQTAQALLAEEVWGVLEREVPFAIGDVNPMNERVRAAQGL